MTVETPQKVTDFLNKTRMLDYEKFQILEKLRIIVFDNFPNAEERFMYGGIMLFDEDQDFGGLFIYKNHISFEFSAGSTFKDPKNLLEGSGKFRRHLKLISKKDIVSMDVDKFLKQALKAHK